ncbi:septal ring lytic transglycosylase RlpA family protein [Aquirufa sp. ROCK2-A2]
MRIQLHHSPIKCLAIFILLLIGINTKAQEDSTGLASFYSKRLNGRRTTSGEKFNSNKFTCAHRTYPFNSWLEVTSLRTQKKTYVRVNDRGPHKKTRLIDVSYIAAKELGIIGTGIAAVKVRLLGEKELTDSLLAVLKKKEKKKLGKSK